MSNSTVDTSSACFSCFGGGESVRKQKKLIPLTEMNRHTLCAPLSGSCSSAVLEK